ncbi:MAG: chorismate synthase [Saprospiraceae bacterium]
MNTFGRIFRISIFGESHGVAIGVTIDGCPPGIEFSESDMLQDLDRRKSGAKGTTPRKESDLPKIISGVFNGKTTGSPITIIFNNENTKSSDYKFLKDSPRPGHSDFVANKKFNGYNDFRGGGHFSGRLTLGLVAAGSIAKKIIDPINIKAKIIEIGGSTDFENTISKAMESGDSVGGIVECNCENIPIGLGEPFFDSLESNISHMVFAIPATKGIEFGLGFESSKRYGSEVNDDIIDASGHTATNNSGGINGGISNGNNLYFRVAIKPGSSISKPQDTFNFTENEIKSLSIQGRHDACIALRVPPVLEAATAIVLADMMLLNKRIS